jgi:hypothetical protein
MASPLRRMSRAARLLVIALAMAGMEVDVLSNPFPAEFALSRLHALLAGPAIDDAPPMAYGAAETDSSPAAEEAPGADTVLIPDETVALRPRHRARRLITRGGLAGSHLRLPAAPPHQRRPAKAAARRPLSPADFCRFHC